MLARLRQCLCMKSQTDSLFPHSPKYFLSSSASSGSFLKLHAENTNTHRRSITVVTGPVCVGLTYLPVRLNTFPWKYNDFLYFIMGQISWRVLHWVWRHKFCSYNCSIELRIKLDMKIHLLRKSTNAIFCNATWKDLCLCVCFTLRSKGFHVWGHILQRPT